jgi:hypothetical protein
MSNVIVLTGAGISAESGIKTFRDSNGLWENHRVEDVASPEGFIRNPNLVWDFYKQRYTQSISVEPMVLIWLLLSWRSTWATSFILLLKMLIACTLEREVAGYMKCTVVWIPAFVLDVEPISK